MDCTLRTVVRLSVEAVRSFLRALDLNADPSTIISTRLSRSERDWIGHFAEVQGNPRANYGPHGCFGGGRVGN